MKEPKGTEMSWRPISGKTGVTGIIGDPIEHTVTPPMYNTAYERLGLDYIHVAFQVDAKYVGDAVKAVRALNLKGLIVTMPHKRAVIPFLDELDPLTEKIGAVNTIINNNGMLKGYNSDAPAFLQPLLSQGFQPEGRNIVVLGAGGGSRAVTFILASRGANLVILNRMEEFDWAIELAKNLSDFSGKEVRPLELTEENLKTSLAKADLVVNATSVGFGPRNRETPVPAKLLRSDLPVYDIVFSPLKTRLLEEAERKGAKTLAGMGMVVGTGVFFFEKVTGTKAPVELMNEVVFKILKEREK